MYRRFIKKPMDIILSLLAILVLSPILIIVAILVRVKLGSPVLFKQKRPGLNGEIFTMYKFRTMTDEKNENGVLLPNHMRLTKFGRILRATSLDELPELFNILRGDMSIIGPRPLLIEYLPLYNDKQKKRHDVRPGLSGLAQINGRNAISWEEKFDYDVKYVHNLSFLLDIKLIFQTLLKVFKREDVNKSEDVTMEKFTGTSERINVEELLLMDRDIYIVGAGTYGEVMCELAEILGYIVKGFYDEDESKYGLSVMGHQVLGAFSELNEMDISGNKFIVAIGNNSVRLEIMQRIASSNGITPTLIHPTAVISPSAVIGKGVYIQANAYIWTKVKIEDYCIISPNVVVCHHTSIGRGCLISNVTGVGASIQIQDRVFIGMGSTIVTGLHVIGENSIIGAGAVVLKDVEKNSVYVGVPARKIRDITRYRN